MPLQNIVPGGLLPAWVNEGCLNLQRGNKDGAAIAHWMGGLKHNGKWVNE